MGQQTQSLRARRRLVAVGFSPAKSPRQTRRNHPQIILLRHRRTWPRFVECENVRLMTAPHFVAPKTTFGKGRTVQPVGGFAGLHFFDQVRDSLQDASRLIYVIADALKLSRAT